MKHIHIPAVICQSISISLDSSLLITLTIKHDLSFNHWTALLLLLLIFFTIIINNIR